MKKPILVLLLVLLLSGTSVFSIGVGLAWNVNVGNNDFNTGSASFLLSHDKIPGTILGLRVASSNNATSLTIFDDWWLYKQNLTGPLHLALGLGGALSINSYNDSVSLDLGMRIPVDLRLFVLDPLEFFIEWAPVIGVGGIPEALVFPTFDFGGVALGFRFWF